MNYESNRNKYWHLFRLELCKLTRYPCVRVVKLYPAIGFDVYYLGFIVYPRLRTRLNFDNLVQEEVTNQPRVQTNIRDNQTMLAPCHRNVTDDVILSKDILQLDCPKYLSSILSSHHFDNCACIYSVVTSDFIRDNVKYKILISPWSYLFHYKENKNIIRNHFLFNMLLILFVSSGFFYLLSWCTLIVYHFFMVSQIPYNLKYWVYLWEKVKNIKNTLF